MTVSTISTAVTTIGFPCALCIVLLWYFIKYVNDKDTQNREDTKEQITSLREENKETLRLVNEENRRRELESRKREEKLQGVIGRNQDIISDLAEKLDVISVIGDKVDNIKDEVDLISQEVRKK